MTFTMLQNSRRVFGDKNNFLSKAGIFSKAGGPLKGRASSSVGNTLVFAPVM